MQGNLKDALQYAASNPDSGFAQQLATDIKAGKFDTMAQQLGLDLTPVKNSSIGTAPVQEAPTSTKGFMLPGQETMQKFATGVGSAIIDTAKGIGNLIGLKPSETGQKIINTSDTLDNSTAKDVGKVAGNIEQLVSGSGEVSAATKYLPTALKYGARALGTGGIVAAQEGEVGLPAVLAGATEGLSPLVTKLLAPVSRFVKSLASGLSGAPSKAIDAIIAEPQVARSVATETALPQGAMDVMKRNAETVINGVSQIRREAGTAFREGLSQLKAEDINPTTYREKIGEFLNSVGSVVKSNGTRVLQNVEFDDPTMLKKASGLIDQLSSTPLDGLSQRNLMNKIENAAFKTTGSDANRLSFNAFVRDMAHSVRESLLSSTDKLGEMNAAYSKDLQLSDAIESIFGNVKFKNLDELRKVSQKLEGLFGQKGMTPEIVDSFLTRIGVKPSEFRASEAVRQIGGVTDKGNTQGLTLAEVIRGVTSSVITPKVVQNAAIITGLSEKSLMPILTELSPIGRATLIRALTEVYNKATE